MRERRKRRKKRKKRRRKRRKINILIYICINGKFNNHYGYVIIYSTTLISTNMERKI
jgi:hypothetical protein